MSSSSSSASSWFTPPVDATQLSNVDAKTEMRERYGITSFSDCIEPGDLQKKLAEYRITLPITHGLRYGRLLSIGNLKTPTGIVTLSHGLGDSAEGWEDIGHELARRFPYLLFLLPTAPSRPVTINGGMSSTSWYDIKSMIGDDLLRPGQDNTQVRQSVAYVRSLAYTTASRLKVNPRRIVYAGFSQGAAMSLAAGLTAAPYAPAGVICMSGYLAAAYDVLQNVVNRDSPIAMFHGRQDPVVPFAAAKATRDVLMKEAKITVPIEFKEYNMQHSASPQEIEDVADFLSRVLPERFE